MALQSQPGARVPIERRALMRVVGIGFWGPLFVLVVACFWYARCAIPSVHRIGCSHHAADQEFVIGQAVTELRATTRLPVRFVKIKTDRRERYDEFSTVGQWLRESNDSTQAWPAFRRFAIARLDVCWFARTRAVLVGYVLRDYTALDGQTVLDGPRQVAPHPRWAMTFNGGDRDEANRRALASFYQTFAARSTNLGLYNPDSLMTRTWARVTKHERTLSAFDTWRLKAMWIALALCFVGSVALYVRDLRRAKRIAVQRFRVYHPTNRRCSSQPPGWRWWFSPDLAGSLLRYEERLRRDQREHRLAERTAERERRLREVAEQSEAAFVHQVRGLREFITAACVQGPAAAAVLALMQRAEDGSLPLEVRRGAYHGAQILMRQHLEPAKAAASSPVPYPERLRGQVAGVDLTALPSERRMQFEQALAQARQGDRESVQLYWLERALATAQSTSGESAPVSVAVEPRLAASEEVRVEPRIACVEDLVELLNIGRLLPPEINRDYAAAIILHGLMKPLQRGRAAFKGDKKGRYRRPNHVREDTGSKIGWWRFDTDVYDATLVWLLKAGVVVTKPKSDEDCLALNARPQLATPDGRPIVERVIACYQHVQRELHRSGR